MKNMPTIFTGMGSENITVLKGMNEYLPIISMLLDPYG